MKVSKIKTLIPAPESAFTVDLDNEHVSWPTDSGGNTTDEQECYTVPRAYYGSRNVIGDCSISVISTNDPDITIDTTAFKTTGIRIWVDEEVWFEESHEIVFRITHPTYGSRDVTFWLSFVRAGANGQTAVLYELLPSLSVISFARQADGSLTPSSRSLTVSIKKTTGSSSVVKTISETGLTVRYSTSAMPASKTGGQEFPSSLTINSSATFNNVYIAAFNSAGTLVDRETIPVIKDGDSSVVYWITSSVPSIAADENGHPVNPNEAIEVKEWKRVGNNPGVTSNDLKMTCYTVKDGVKTLFGQSNWAPTANFTSAAADGKDSICVELYDASDNIVRSLSIPVEKKGDKGDDGVTYEILPSVAQIRADKDGNILTGIITVSAYKIKGENRTSCGVGLPRHQGDTSPYYWVQYRVNDGSWTSCSTISIGSGVTAQLVYGVPASAVSTITSGIAFRLCYGTGSSSYSVVHEMAALQVVKDGQTGTRGKTGRYYYYDGYFNSSKEYTATDHQAPYVAFDWTDTETVNGVQTQVVKTSYYMLIADTNKPSSTYIAPRTQAASGVWELMETSFKWLIAEAFFTNFAKLGSAVFCGDWMISQHGTVNGVASTQYELFDDEDPTGTVAGHFVPNFAIDLLEGQAYFGGNKVRFNADGSGWLANKNIEWDAKGNLRFAGLTYKKKTVITPDNLSEYMSVVGTDYDNNGNVVDVYMLDIMKAGNWIILDGIQPGVYIKLPSFRFDGTYTDAEKDLARSLVGCSIIINSINHTYICGFRKTHLRFYDIIDVAGNRLYYDDNSPNAGNIIFSNAQTVYLECVLADTKDSNGRYREDIMWKARLVSK